MSNFAPFGKLVQRQFDSMTGDKLFRTVLSGDEIYAAYLASFPEGTNPIFRERTEHDCTTCRNFIKNLGGVVTITPQNTLTTVWDVEGAEYPYDVVAKTMGDLIRKQEIASRYYSTERKYGAEKTISAVGSEVWHHFCGDTGVHHAGVNAPSMMGAYNSSAIVFTNTLEKFTTKAVAIVLDLIGSNSLYRGIEFEAGVFGLSHLLMAYQTLQTAEERHNFIWVNADKPGARVKNTAIGTLIEDLSEGVELEKAVKAYESKVAPANYKRPTALITPRMIEDAVKTIRDLGHEDALQRRHATLEDISVNDILWVNNESATQMKDSLKDLLNTAVVPKPVKNQEAKPVSMEDFLEKVLPTASKVEVLFEGNKQSNLMSITAPVHQNSGQLFKWHNNFAWSYKGNVTDAFVERVKREGGKVEGAMRASLIWYNRDDLDIHAHTPKGHIAYFDRTKGSGRLDIDANGSNGMMDEPVENIVWSKLEDGDYQIDINQYSCRSRSDVGFALQLVVKGDIYEVSYPKALQGTIRVATYTIKKGELTNLKFHKDVQVSSSKQNVWGIDTNTFVPVNFVTVSPNHWDGKAIGNKHWFFILDECVSDEPTRGIYNEYLKPELETHRKVFEVLGEKTKCPMSNKQLSGLGFSSTKHDTVTLRVVVGNEQVLYNVAI